ncbi:Phytoene desaturase [Penicillium chermesinum]|uniref:Phytoene desaturase n=1 Tax=Penicillium chermesinum TaxID=63820 RepID=A0A9W9NZW3_9EURO|nr:Phytoene desaturase [Penicillium chermesinum]KAJ5232788.1 Phytoene desaturase [Penicillium chermesinum]KAJ6172448.1 Phytoene desaturase [Penicillium chermesinum]
MTSSRAVIVGAGAGGIATAARLAKAGYEVTVIEKNGFLGGRCSLICREGYRFDQGPSLLLMPEVFYQTFRDLGTSLEDEHVRLLKCEPNYRIWFSDNDSLEMSTDISKMKEQIERHEGRYGLRGFLGFLNESGRHYDLSFEHVLAKDFPSLFSMMRPQLLKVLLPLHPFESMWSRVKRYFRSDKIRRAFTFASMYLGMNPFEAPGTYSLLQYTELAHGILYPEGGFVKVLEAIASVGKRLGVEFRLNTEVESIVSGPDGRVSGVRLKSGEELHADVVVVNADLVYSYNNLLPPTSYAKQLTKRPASCSSISFFWSFDRVIPELEVHNIFLAEEYKESFDAIFHRHELPTEPSFYVNVPSRIDPTAAPEGKDAVVVLVPVGHLTDDPSKPQDWQSLVNYAREVVFKTIEARTGASGLQESLVHEAVETPTSWKSKFNLDRGAILGLSHSFFNVLSFRPKIKHASIDGLYFVGASTHPGAGVPVSLQSAKIVTEAIIKAFSRQGVFGHRALWISFTSILLLVFSKLLWRP